MTAILYCYAKILPLLKAGHYSSDDMTVKYSFHEEPNSRSSIITKYEKFNRNLLVIFAYVWSQYMT
jgi:hypothetical protein